MVPRGDSAPGTQPRPAGVASPGYPGVATRAGMSGVEAAGPGARGSTRSREGDRHGRPAARGPEGARRRGHDPLSGVRPWRLRRSRPPRRAASPRRGRGRRTGSAGARTSPSASGARCARTTRADGTAWDYFPHDHARSRAYRWGEDGLLGISDDHQRALLRARALERARSHPQGAALRPDRPRGQPRRGRQGVLLLPRRHADPLVHAGALQVPAARVPLRAAASRRTRGAAAASRSSSSLDTGVFDEDRYFDVFVEYAKAGPNDILVRMTVENRGPEAAALHVLPTLWFRNTWSWDRARPKPRLVRADGPRRRRGRARRARGAVAGDCGSTPRARPACSSPRTRRPSRRLFGDGQLEPVRKDAFHDSDRARPRGRCLIPGDQGTKVGAQYRLRVPPGGRAVAAAPPGRRRPRRRPSARVRAHLRRAPSARPTSSTRP